MTITLITAALAVHLAYGVLPTVRLHTIVLITLWITGFLCLLNIALALLYRRRQWREVASYYVACVVELAIFTFVLLFSFGVVSAPFHLPPNLQVNQGEIGAALAIGIGLFPAAYWHSINLSELPKRMAEDAKVLKDREAAVQVRKGSPNEWMN